MLRGPGSRAEFAASIALAAGLAGCGGSSGGDETSQAPATSRPAATASPTPASAGAVSDASTWLRPKAAFGRLERQYDARLGVFAVDTGSGRALAHRAGERFAYNSTVKALMAAVLLQDRTDAQLSRVVQYSADDLAANSPVTERNVDSGMTLRALASAAVRYSDNAAANLIFDDLGGPAAFQRRLRAAGDRVTNSDRIEPDLSEATPGDERDTTTPRQLATTLRTFALGDALPPGRRDQLVGWLRRNTTGDALIRAGAPTGWTVGDKTGSGGYGSRNDVAILWPPNGAPIVLAILSTRDTTGAEHDDALIADAARLAIRTLRVS
ncbi:MAG: class A beta-lactamase [Solirubrobacteraceae bacterium]|nr:class A beta-lactamase [Solirubrobacteraceae bacterium]